MQGIDRSLIDRVLDEARRSPRQRKNFNFHDRDNHPCQRLLNAILPQSYIQPHRHLDPDKEEMLVVLRGRLGLVFFDDAGHVVDTALLEAGGERLAASIPPGRFHTLVALDDGAGGFEAKAGPYLPHAPREKASFAPEEAAQDAASYLNELRKLFGAG